tara:strand:+ start:4959 stop:6464 length:1506 start_codon:yes stop_codon:yes gene_type:complete
MNSEKEMLDNKTTPKLNFDSLIQIIEEQMSVFNLLTEDETATIDYSNVNISLPTIKITEDWGKMNSKDRAIIEGFTKRIGGTSLEEKIASINSIIAEKKEAASISEILSSMVVCEILSSIIREFTESAGGFIFEGFLAGLFGGESVQITGPEDIGSGASGKPITDVILNDKHYSLKLLGQTTGVKGSFRNMVEHFADYDHVIYLDARRINQDQGLEFGEFLITLQNFLDVFVTPFLREVTTRGVEIETATGLKQFLQKLDSEGKPVKFIKFSKVGFVPGQRAGEFKFSPSAPSRLNEVGVRGEDLNKILNRVMQTPDEDLQEFAPFVINHADRRFEGTKAQKLFGSIAVVDILKRNIESGDKDAIIDSLRQTAGYQGKEQFEFTRDQAEEIRGFRSLGTLMIGEQYMKQTWAAYADLLKETIGPVYATLQTFTGNVNNYFLATTEEGQNRKQFALDAIQDAEKLQQATSNAVQAIDGGASGGETYMDYSVSPPTLRKGSGS